MYKYNHLHLCSYDSLPTRGYRIPQKGGTGDTVELPYMFQNCYNSLLWIYYIISLSSNSFWWISCSFVIFPIKFFVIFFIFIVRRDFIWSYLIYFSILLSLYYISFKRKNPIHNDIFSRYLKLKIIKKIICDGY